MIKNKQLMRESLKYEIDHYGHAPLCIIGFDEAGRGALAGPIVVAAVGLRSGFHHPLIQDSKQLTAKERKQAADIIKNNALYLTISIKDNNFIDQHNPKQTSILAMIEAFGQLTIKPDVCLIDFEKPTFPNFAGQLVSLVKGDQKSINIAAASIIAKVTRDQIMEQYDLLYHQYGFKNHKGYGTVQHLQALTKNGPCAIHRKSYAPVKKVLAQFVKIK